MNESRKQHAPAARRNCAPIAATIKPELPESGTVLEVASGSGEHAVFFAGCFPQLEWQPSDRFHSALGSIAAWRAESERSNLRPPILLDARSGDWPQGPFAAILCINMVHISPWEATEGLFAGAGQLLHTAAPLILYGPYLESGVETAPSNIAFDQSLKARDPRWGLRDTADIDALAGKHGFARTARHSMPANNITLVYRKA